MSQEDAEILKLKRRVATLENELAWWEDNDTEATNALHAIADLIPENPYARRADWETLARKAVEIAERALSGHVQ